MTEDALKTWAAEKGIRLEVLSLESLESVKDRMSRLQADGSLAMAITKCLGGFKYLADSRVEAPRSVIVMAMPRPAHTLKARMDEEIDLVIPPTYANYIQTAAGVCAGLQADFGLSDREIDRASAPYKSLAALSGLTRYGRNNIGYVEGFGSWVQLMAFVTRAPLGGERSPAPIESRRLARCESCRACVSACPTGAIHPDRFLIHAERCYTLFSEDLSPIPDSMPVPSPQCLVGCMKCQEACPENKGLLRHESTGIVFDREETAAMLNDPEQKEERAWKSIKEKLSPLGVSDDAPLYARNFRRAMQKKN